MRLVFTVETSKSLEGFLRIRSSYQVLAMLIDTKSPTRKKRKKLVTEVQINLSP